jgi:hypothetical protein
MASMRDEKPDYNKSMCKIGNAIIAVPVYFQYQLHVKGALL